MSRGPLPHRVRVRLLEGVGQLMFSGSSLDFGSSLLTYFLAALVFLARDLGARQHFQGRSVGLQPMCYFARPTRVYAAACVPGVHAAVSEPTGRGSGTRAAPSPGPAPQPPGFFLLAPTLCSRTLTTPPVQLGHDVGSPTVVSPHPRCHQDMLAVLNLKRLLSDLRGALARAPSCLQMGHKPWASRSRGRRSRHDSIQKPNT